MAKTKLEELVVELAVENKDLITALKASQSATDKSMKEMSKSIQSLVDDSGKSVSGLQRIMETAVGFVGGQMIIGALDAAASAATGFFKAVITNGVAAAQVQEDAIQRMNTQLALNGNYSAEASADMQAFASALQKTTKIGDETTLSMIALAGTFGKSNEETKKLVEAAIELSAATGMSLEGAVKNLGKTYAGMTGELGESLPIIRTLTAEQLKSGAALDLIINRFGGSAAAQVKTFSGGVQQLSNSWGDLTEEIGSVITQNKAVLNVIEALNKIITESSSGIKSHQQALQELVARGLVNLLIGIENTVRALDSLIEGNSAATRSFRALSWAAEAAFEAMRPKTRLEQLETEIAKTEASIERLKKGMSGASPWEAGSLQITIQRMQANLRELKTELESQPKNETFLSTVAEKLQRMREAAQAGYEEIKSGADASDESLRRLSEAAQKAAENRRILTEEEKKAAEERKKMAEDGKALAEALIIAMEDDSETRYLMIEEQFAKEEELLNQHHLRNKTSIEAHEIAVDELRKKYQKLDKDRKDKEIKEDEERQKKLIQDRMTTLSNLAQLQNSSNQQMATIGKAAALTQIGISTHEGAIKAYSSLAGIPIVGPALGAAAAAALVAYGAERAAKVAGFNDGGTVPGIGFKDTVPAMLTPGEEIIDKSTSKALRSALRAGGMGSTEIVRVEISIRDADVMAEILEAKIVERRREGRSLLGAA